MIHGDRIQMSVYGLSIQRSRVEHCVALFVKLPGASVRNPFVVGRLHSGNGLKADPHRHHVDTMSEEEKEPNEPPESSKPIKEHIRVGPLEPEDSTVEWDPEGRFQRYEEQIGQGKFKTVFRGYDTENGIDVAWCKVRDPDEHSPPDMLDRIYNEMKNGLNLDHSSIIKCFACWIDRNQSCIHLITELFTSGTLRSYLRMYSNASMNVHRKYIRQILHGLVYLHARIPPVVHADIRLDKVYVNGFNGEVKIGDLGLASLLSRRYPSSAPPEFDSPLEDLVSLGLCVYELVTGTELKRENLGRLMRELNAVKNPDAKKFIEQCLGSVGDVTAAGLLDHPFLKSQTSFKFKRGNEWDIGRFDSQKPTTSTKLRGEDWSFDLEGYESDDNELSLHIRLTMSKEADTDHVTVLDFDYHLEVDTPDSVGGDIADKFQLSSTDRELCIAALKEWLAVMAASKLKLDDIESS